MRYLASLLPLLTALLLSAPAWAVPAQLAHQGRLLDAEGAPLDGSHTLSFTLFDAESDGAEVWSEDIDAVLVGGFYSVVLGADEDGNPLDDLVLGGGALWLELRVDDGEPLLPRHELLSVPYAVMAGTATNVEGGYVDATEIAVHGDVVIDGDGNWTGPTPEVDWTDLSGVPGELLDGEDADTLGALVCPDGEVPKYETASGNWVCGQDEVLDSGAVLGFVDGAVVDLGAGSAVDGTAIATLDDLSWDLLSDIPPEFLDSDADTLGGLSCADGGIAAFDLGAGTWGCGSDGILDAGGVLAYVNGSVVDLGAGSSAGGVVLATIDDLTWAGLVGIPAGFLDEVDDDTLADLGLTCGNGDRPSWDLLGGAWVCSTAEVGLDRIETASASAGQVLTFDGANVAWEDPAAPASPPCSLTALDESFGGARADCDGTSVLLRTWLHASSLGAGDFHTCAATPNGDVVCWGHDHLGESSPPTGTFTEVGSGEWFSCGLRTDGTIECWGGPTYGQTSPPAGTYIQLSVGQHHSCAVAGTGDVDCWGAGWSGQTTPPSASFSQVSAGGEHTCGIDASGAVQCWGRDYEGQSSPPSGSFLSVSAGDDHTCAVAADESILCWGLDNYGQSTPPSGTFQQVSAGGSHSCGIDTSGLLHCWGHSSWGQTAPPEGTFAFVEAGLYHTCAVRTGLLGVECWGQDTDGQASPP